MSRQQLRAHAVEHFRTGGGSRPDVLRIDIDGVSAVLKDHNACDPWFARCFGALLAWRESRALKRLAGVQGVPRLLGRPDSRCLLLEYLPGVQLRHARSQDWPGYFVSLANSVSALHKRGVAHCDLRSPSNTLVGLDGVPIIVDFVASVCDGARWNLPARWLFRQFCRADDEAIIKLKNHVAPQLLDPSERERLEHQTLLARVARRIGSGVRKITRRLFTASS